MARPGRSAADVFTSREVAIAADLTARNFALLADQNLAPGPSNDGLGKAGHRTYDSAGLAHAALIGALHLAGFELLVSARLAAAFAGDCGASYGRLPSNLNAFVRGEMNPNKGLPWGEMPKDLTVDFEQDYWLHHLLRNRSEVYKRGIAIRGDCIIEIADHALVLTTTLGLEKIKIFSPVSREGLPANPDYRIVGRGASAQIVPIHQEVDSLDFQINPKSAEKMRRLEQEYLSGRTDAVTLVRVNLSLAIRNAFDRVQDDRESKAAA